MANHIPISSSTLLFALMAAAPVRAQVQTTEPQPNVFHGNSQTCIFNDGTGNVRDCIFDTATFLSAPAPTQPGFFGSSQRLRSDDVTFTGTGFDLGGETGGWTLQQGQYRRVTSYTRGITQNLSSETHCRRIGDCANYFYVYHDGGVAATGDEGVEALGLQAIENDHPYAGQLLATSGTGDTQPKISGSSNQWVTDGGELLDITRGTLQGELAGASTPFADYLVQLRLTSSSLPKSTAWGTILAGYDKAPTLANVSLPILVDVTLGALDGSPRPFQPGAVCVTGPGQFEQAVLDPPDATLPSAKPGHQWLRMHVRYPNPDMKSEGVVRSPMLFQGGVCGQYVSADADLKFSGMRTTYPAFGSLTGADLITGKQVAGIMMPYLPQPGQQAWLASGPGSRFHLYPGAEIVANTRLTPQLEPNRVPWTVGDRIESPHYMTVGQTVLFIGDTQNSPTDRSYGGSALQLTMRGKGMAGQHRGISLVNIEPSTSYLPYGGPLVPPNATWLEGQFNDAQRIGNAPNHALSEVTFCNAAGRFSLFDLPGTKSDHAVDVAYDCATGRISLPRLTVESANATQSLQRNGSEVCTEDGAHCPASAHTASISVRSLAVGSCAAFTAPLAGLTDRMTITATARANPGLVTTSTYVAAPALAGLVVCSPAGPSQAVVYNLSAH